MDEVTRSLRKVAQKINFAKATLQGPNKSIRDEEGFSHTAARLITSFENFADNPASDRFSLSEALMNGFRRAANTRHNFSASDLASVRDVDVADIAIATTVASHGLTYIAMERAMDAVAQQITFQGLRALNDAAGFEKGKVVVDPRQAFSPDVDFGRDGARDEKALDMVFTSAEATALKATDLTKTVAFNAPIVIGETEILVGYVDKAGNVTTGDPFRVTDAARKNASGWEVLAFDTGKEKADAQGNVELVFKSYGLKSASINIESGLVTVEYDSSILSRVSGKLPVLKVSACYDRIAEKDGAHTLKLKPYMDSTELVATPNRVVLQSSVEVQAQMNKILRKNATYGINVDFGKRAIDQIVALYTYFIDVNIVRNLWNGVKKSDVEAQLDLSGYASDNYTSFAATKNDRLGNFTDQLCSTFLNRTGSPITALIVDEKAGLMYQSDKESFVPDPAILQRRDGLIGTYKGIPVVRNAFLNDKGGTDDETGRAKGTVIGVYKSPDGSAAPVAMGDYLPPYSTLPAVNSQNPGELSQALFSQTACKCVVPQWAIRGEIIPFGAYTA